MDDQKHNMKLTTKQVSVTQHGVYDRNILCQKCDNILGSYDDYALEICERFNPEHVIRPAGIFELANVDCDRFAIFILSVLWRGSISSRPEFQKVALGPYEEIARDVLFGDATLTSMPSFQLIVGRFVNSPINTEHFYTSPARMRFVGGCNAWHFALSGFKIIAKLDRRELPAPLRSEVVNGHGVLRGKLIDYLRSSDHRTMIEMVLAEQDRRTGHRQANYP